MTDDLLERSVRALRAGTEPHDDGADEMLARIERSRLPSISRSRVRFRAATLAFAAAFVGFGAWAAVTGRVASFFDETTREETHAVPDATASPTSIGKRKPNLSTTSAPTEVTSESAAPTISDEIPPTPPKSVPNTPRSTPRPSASVATSSEAKQPEAPKADVNELYRAAHRLHFTERNWSGALAAWDRYLSEAGPRGSMFLEARYNRALVLMRLGRNAEARAALKPFAEGEYGGYRRDEARALLDRLKQ
jgi:hypothetical protein